MTPRHTIRLLQPQDPLREALNAYLTEQPHLGMSAAELVHRAELLHQEALTQAQFYDAAVYVAVIRLPFNGMSGAFSEMPYLPPASGLVCENIIAAFALWFRHPGVGMHGCLLGESDVVNAATWVHPDHQSGSLAAEIVRAAEVHCARRRWTRIVAAVPPEGKEDFLRLHGFDWRVGYVLLCKTLTRIDADTGIPYYEQTEAEREEHKRAEYAKERAEANAHQTQASVERALAPAWPDAEEAIGEYPDIPPLNVAKET